MERINCPKCLDRHGWKSAMWQVPLTGKNQTRWLHQCPVCHLLFSADDTVTSKDVDRVYATDEWTILGLKSVP